MSSRKISHALLHPLGPEADARLALAQVVLVMAARVDGLTEQRDPGLRPQPAPEQQRRVRRHGDHRSREQLGQVVHARELSGVHLEVDLEARVARLDHHRVVLDDDLVEPLDRELERAAAQLVHRLVERHVARARGHVVEPEVGLPHRRQDPHQHGVHAKLVGGLAGLVDQLVQLLLHPRQPVAAERLRVRIGLDLELAELGREVGILQLLEHRQHAARRGPSAVEQEHLLLRADPPDPGLEPALLEHALHRAQVGEDRGHELAALLAVGSGAIDVLVIARGHDVHSVRICGSIFRQVGQS